MDKEIEMKKEREAYKQGKLQGEIDLLRSILGQLLNIDILPRLRYKEGVEF